jgi:hypothetical protein
MASTGGNAQSAGEYEFSERERPAFPGGPYSPDHALGRRLAYGAAAFIISIASTFPNALVNTNTGNLAGPLGIFVAQANWLPAIYVAMNATANLTLVKARTQFGIPQITQGLLALYFLAGMVQLLWPSFATAAATRAVNGITASALLTLSIYYLMQAFPEKMRPLALVCGIGLPQLGTPLARMIPVDLLAADQWHGLRLLEPSLALLLFALMRLLPLPRSDRIKVFEKMDIVTIAVFVPATLLFCGVMALGRTYWWTNAPFLGWMLAASIALIGIALLIEFNRRNPLLHLNWLGGADMLRFAIVSILVRLALAEQTYGSVGLLTSGGLDNDQLRTLFAWVALAMFSGVVVACLTLSPGRLRIQVASAALIIATGALIDAGSTNLTRPQELYLSQALIGFGTTLFIGPGLVYGFLRMMAKGPNHLVSFIVLFGITQNVGGLAGAALLGSYQIVQAREHAVSLAGNVVASDPQVVDRIRHGVAALASAIPDAGLGTANGAGLLGRALQSEANVLAYNDVFRLVACIALIVAVYLIYRIVLSWLHRPPAPGASP